MPHSNIAKHGGKPAGHKSSTQPEDRGVTADLRKARLPANQTRVHVLTHMRALDRPITPDALCEQLDGRVGRVSIYRVLAELARADLVSSFRLPRGKVVYRIRQPHEALSVVCPECGRSDSAKDAALRQLLCNALAGLGYGSEDMQVLAVCHRCAAP